MIKLNNINKIYNSGTINETCLFTDFNFEVKKGEFISIVGSNGSGKTSMLNIMRFNTHRQRRYNNKRQIYSQA